MVRKRRGASPSPWGRAVGAEGRAAHGLAADHRTLGARAKAGQVHPTSKGPLGRAEPQF